MVIRALLLLLGLFHVLGGAVMLFLPGQWFAAVPGVPMTGPFNHHFVQDVGLAFIASGVGLGWGASRNPRAGILAAAGAVWPALHALLHVWGWFTGGMTDSRIVQTEAMGVMLPAALGITLAWLRLNRRTPMFKSLMHNRVRQMEHHYGYDAGYIHEMIDASPAAATKFLIAQPMSNHREDVPKDAWYAAKLAAALSEDCGPCTQLCVNMATEAGVEPTKIAHLLRGDIEAAGADAALGFRYGIAVATNSDQVMALVERARVRYGARGLVSLALVVTSGRMYPALKRGLGHGMMCSKITVSDESILVKHAA